MDICPCLNNFLLADVASMLLIFSSYSFEVVLLVLSELSYLLSSILLDLVDLLVDLIFFIL